MRRTLVMAPGLDGMNRDDPEHLIGPNQSLDAQDAIRLRGLLTNMRGWSFDGTVQDYSGFDSTWVYRAKFVLAGTVVTVVGAGGAIYLHNAAGAATLLTATQGSILPRCVYGDSLVFCAGDGLNECRFYSGVTAAPTDQVQLQTVSGQSVLTRVAGVATFGATTVPGLFFGLDVGAIPADGNPTMFPRITERNSTTSITLEDIKASATQTIFALAAPSAAGVMFPCVPVYEEGTVTFSAGADSVAGTGTKWDTGGWGQVNQTLFNDALIALPSGADAQIFDISTLTSDTALGIRNNQAYTNVRHKILRRGPFTDAAAHRGSFAGTGCKQHPNAVWLSPQGWNPALPPGFVPPVDPCVAMTSDDPRDFELFRIDVPTRTHRDPNVALLSRPEGLRVIKRDEVHTIFGDYPNFSQGPLATGAGCIDRLSVVNLPSGGFWAGANGVYRDQGGRLDDITEYRRRSGGINRDWRVLATDFDPSADYCTIAEGDGRLVVAITNGGLAATYTYDLRDEAWSCKVTRAKARFLFSSKIPGEAEKLLMVADANRGRVMDLIPALNGTGTAKNADGTSPVFQYRSGKGLGQAAGIEGEVLVGDVAIHANVRDVSSTNTKITPSVAHSGGVRAPAAGETVTLDVISADTVDLIDRHDRRVNRSGRLVQVRLDGDVSTGTNDTNTKIEVSEIAVELFDAAVGT